MLKSKKFWALVFVGILGVTSLATHPALTERIYRIEVDRDRDFSKRELRERVYMLELAVQQLQERVFDLEVEKRTPPPPMYPTPSYPAPSYPPPITPMPPRQPRPMMFTCYIQAFGKTFSASAPTEMAAKVEAMRQCSQQYNAIHCGEDDVKCGR